ncbi:hypothetical protein K5X85_29050 [Streptomyces sp. A144]|uniref:hypothetical protein n=1 Tax=Streptomyces sp. A144 TaxID=2871487 RepID=UPI001CBC94AC|nr:hypothetical protein [Streptomyces sp. A144]UAX56777.1 hypothetical protein K5X85_29050 [Streptomyces sp. A144]
MTASSQSTDTTTTPVRAAAGIIAETMRREGGATALDIAMAEYNAGILFNPDQADGIAQAAREQSAAELRAELDELREENASLLHMKAQLDGIRRALAGRPDTDLMLVSEILAAADPRQNVATSAPLAVYWDGVVMGPSGDTDGENTLVPGTTAHGGPAALVLGDAQRLALGGLLLAHLRTGKDCPTPGCGTPADELDASDPHVWGWVLVDVAGTEGPARWHCNPWCASAAITAGGAELAAADEDETPTATNPAVTGE